MLLLLLLLLMFACCFGFVTDQAVALAASAVVWATVAVSLPAAAVVNYD